MCSPRLDHVRQLVVRRMVGAPHLAAARRDVADEGRPVGVELPLVGLPVGRDDAVRAVRHRHAVLVHQQDADPDEVRILRGRIRRPEDRLGRLLGKRHADPLLHLAPDEELPRARRAPQVLPNRIGRRIARRRSEERRVHLAEDLPHGRVPPVEAAPHEHVHLPHRVALPAGRASPRPHLDDDVIAEIADPPLTRRGHGMMGRHTAHSPRLRRTRARASPRSRLPLPPRCREEAPQHLVHELRVGAPPVSFITWPTKKPMRLALPARSSAACFGFASTTCRHTASIAPASLTCCIPSSATTSSRRAVACRAIFA